MTTAPRRAVARWACPVADWHAPVIYSQWGGTTLYTGTLASDQNSVRWDNDTGWVRTLQQ